MSSRRFYMVVMLAGCCFGQTSIAQMLQDPSFESYDVAPGEFLIPKDGPWVFNNDAGVVEPFSPNSTLGVDLDTWSATFDAFDGEQYVSTYAARDSISQLVDIPDDGVYIVQVYAAAPDGTIQFPGSDPKDLVTGGFTISIGDQTSEVFEIAPGTDWTLYAAPFVLEAGEQDFRIANFGLASYYIHYDNIAIVPEPATLSLLALGAFATRLRRRRNAWSDETKTQ
ncbi:MAG: PEP-CTERM sorting domain-containing protein [Phycisphaerae bacterium]